MSVKYSLGLLAGFVFGTAASANAQAANAEFAGLLGAPARESAVESAYKRFAASGMPLVIRPAHEGDYIQFPFGYGEAKVHCARLQACPIELQPGERLLDEPLAGDAERWIVETSLTGRNGEVPLVIVKPTDCNLSTNVLIPTDRRVYTISLVSDRCGNGRSNSTTLQRTKFWYPDEMRDAEHELDRIAVAPCEMPDQNRDYSVKQRGGRFLRRDPRFPWTPEKVCDDGIRTFIQLPEGARHVELPVLYQIGEDGEKEMINYTPRGDVIITDRVLRRGALIVNSGGKERRVDIENRGDQGGR